ncbi:MAG: hypothetical protein GKS05_12110 [Nitrospirales bacterium]|nr:hypothetical protein [Nitrospirales bacterium]
MADEARLHITDGTAQNMRFPAALREDYFKVDEMTFEDLLALSVKVASHLHFYNLNNKPEGTWAGLFEADEAVVMAQILSLDLKQLETEFQYRFDSSVEEVGVGLCQFVKDIDGWLKTLKMSNHSSGKALSVKIEEVIEEKLSAEFGDLRECLKRLMEGRSQREPVFDLEGCDPIWARPKTGQPIQPSKLPDSRNSMIEKRLLRSIFYAFFHAVLYLQSVTAVYMQQTLRGQTHDPSVGLLMTFLKLFGDAQERINTFSQRHLNFYYQTLLKASPRDPLPDSADLVLETDAGAREVFIPKGTEFSGGKDLAGKELVYEAESNIVVTDAKIQSLATLFFERNRLISPEAELQYVTRARSNRLPEGLSSGGDPNAPSWPLFGAEEKDGGYGSVEDAQLGFAVASPVLRLKEGVRTITIIIKVSDPADIDPMITRALQEVDAQGGGEKVGAVLDNESYLRMAGCGRVG